MHIYIHIPFCLKVCPYCSFYKHTPGKTDMRAFVQALSIELEGRIGELNGNDGGWNTLYFGGGTPSMLSDKHLGYLFERVKDICVGVRWHEVSFEANPATFNHQRAENWARLGITRVSLGVQSFKEKILRKLGRTHTPAQAVEAIKILRQAGIPQVNVDLMFAIPGQTLAEWSHDLFYACAQDVDHISAYNLNYEEDTAFFASLQAGKMKQDPDADAKFFEYADQILTKNEGMLHYEISNFAKDMGKRSLHNMSYWLGHDYLGIGPGAVTTLGLKRIKNKENTAAYISGVLTNGTAPTEVENLTPSMKRMEVMALMLRTDRGFPMKYITGPRLKLSIDEQARIENVIEWLQRDSLAKLKNRCLILTPKGMLLADAITAELL